MFRFNHNNYEVDEGDSTETDSLSEVSTIDSDGSSDVDFDEDEHDYRDELIFMEDADHFTERINGKYYLGICQYIPYRNINLLSNSVSSRVYFRNEHADVLRYLVNYSIIRVKQPRIEIMKLDIKSDGSYSVILKTYWIRLIQRRWRTIFNQRKRLIQYRKSLLFQKIKELTGFYPGGYNKIPKLTGMLAM